MEHNKKTGDNVGPLIVSGPKVLKPAPAKVPKPTPKKLRKRDKVKKFLGLN